MQATIKNLTILAVLIASFSIHAVESNEPTDSNQTTSTPAKAQPKSGHYLFEKIGGFGGGFMVLYGNGSSMNDTASFGMRGFVHMGNNWRLGVSGTFTGRTNYATTTRDTTGSVGLFAEYLLRFDPVIVGLGVKTGGAAYGSHDRATRARGTTYGYFNAMPFAEVELRLFEYVSMSIYGGYDYFLGNSVNPSISQAVAGLAFTFARY